MSLRNPYTNRNRILCETDFYGRDPELRSIYTRLLGGASVLLVGERRTGKSSILGALSFPTERDSLEIPPEVCIAYTDCQLVAGCDEQQFLEYLAESFATEMELDVPGQIDRAAFKRMGTDARTKKGLHPVLAIDEFDVLLENPKVRPEFLAFLRSWSSFTQVPIALASWEGSVTDLAESPGAGSAFLNVFAPVYVGPMTADDAADLVKTPAERIGEPFEDAQLEWIRQYGGLHPFYLQMAAFHALDAQRTRGSWTAAMEMAEKDFIYDATPHMQLLIGRLTESEREALEDWIGKRSGKREREGYDGLYRKGILIRDPKPRVFSRAFERLFQRERAG